MKILQVGPGYPPEIGGIESFTAWISADLKARGHQVEVLCSHRGPACPVGRGPSDEIPVTRVPLIEAMRVRSPAMLLQSQRAIRAAAEAFVPDVVQLHVGWPMAPAYLGCRALSSTPLVVTVHDIPDSTAQFPTILAVLRRADAIATNSMARLADVRRFDPALGPKAECLYVGRPPRAHDPPAPHRSPEPSLFMAGRQVAEKGFDVAVEAFATVLRTHPAATLHLAGNGPEQGAIRERIAALGIGPSVRLLPDATDDEVAACYRRAWLTLVPSRHSESFGLVALEAMQAGCPVVASRCGGLQEVVEDGVTGRLVAPGSAAALADAIGALLAQPGTLRTMGDAARERAARLFDWTSCIDRYESMLTRAANGRTTDAGR